MCGLLVVLGTAQFPSDAVLWNALTTIAHRGPDGQGTLSLGTIWIGHRRLSIIDTSDDGSQPMSDAVTGVTISYNGEVYNFHELRAELEALGHTFSSRSDTEVLLRSYLQWGDSCVERLNGDWAFVIWDPRIGRAFICRDRFGVKPLYWAQSDGLAVFASEPKAILEIFPGMRKVNERALFRFLGESALYDGTDTFYSGVLSFPRASKGTYDPFSARLDLSKYWSLPAESSKKLACDDWIGAFRTLFLDSVRLRMRSDVPMAITLSGGVDSTAIAAAVQEFLEEGRRITAYTSVFQRTVSKYSDEREWAKIAASNCDSVDLALIDAPGEQWLECVRKIASHMDGPGYSPAVFPLWWIVRRASLDGVKVILEGQGADELLGGYPDHAAAFLIENLRRMRLAKVFRAFLGHARTFGLVFFCMRIARLISPAIAGWNRNRNGAAGVMTESFISRMKSSGIELGAVPKQMEGVVAGPLTASREMRLDFSRRILPGLLQYGDAVSMSQGVESRLPFLDHRLVELCACMPVSMKIRQGMTKYVLREFLLGCGQLAVAKRSDKKGFPTAISEYLKRNDGELLKTLLLSSNTRLGEFCDPTRMKLLVDRYLAGNSRAENPLYRLLSAEIWMQECIPT